MGYRLLCAAIGAFALLSATWFGWGVATSGEHFGGGSGFLVPSLALAVLLGGWGGFKARHGWRILVYTAAVASLCLWVLVP
jgi:hypothetical protein